jgi:hypothetical protein
MRRYKQEITDKTEIDKILADAEVARLAVNRDGAPYVVPMNFGYAEGTFFFHCAGAGLKLELLKADPRVCIEVENSSSFEKAGNTDPCSWGMDYKSVVATGIAEFITDFDEKAAALKSVITKFADVESAPMSEKSINAVTVFKVIIDELTAKQSD